FSCAYNTIMSIYLIDIRDNARALPFMSSSKLLLRKKKCSRKGLGTYSIMRRTLHLVFNFGAGDAGHSESASGLIQFIRRICSVMLSGPPRSFARLIKRFPASAGLRDESISAISDSAI